MVCHPFLSLFLWGDTMTTPILHGYVDYNRRSSRADQLYLDVVDESITGPMTYPPIFVGDLAVAIVKASSNSNPFGITLDWLTDPSGPPIAITQQMDIGAGGRGALPWRNPAPWLQIQVTPGPSTPVSYNLRVLGSDNAMQEQAGVTSSVLVSKFAAPIAANGTVTLDAVTTVKGAASWQASASMANWQADLQVVDHTGVATHIGLIDNNSKGGVSGLFLPAYPARVVVTNLTASAGTFTTYLLADPNAHC